MTRAQTISLRWQGFPHTAFTEAKQGDVWTLLVHGIEYPETIRRNPPRIRLLEDAREPVTECELLDPWPDAPPIWPEKPYGTAPTVDAKAKKGKRR